MIHLSDTDVQRLQPETPSAACGESEPSWTDAKSGSVNDGSSDNTGDEGVQSWKNLLKLDAEVYKQRNIRLLTPEARLLIHLKLSGTLTVTQGMELAGVSYRGFYAVLERLKRAGLVGQIKDRTDQRVRNLRLEPSTPIPPAEL